MAYRRKSRIGKTGCLFWFAIILVIVVIFLYRGRMNLKDSLSFLRRTVEGERVDEGKKTEEDKAPEAEEFRVELTDDADMESREGQKKTPLPVEEKGEEKKASKAEPSGTTSEQSLEEQKTVKKTTPQLKTKKLNAVLYFAKINSSDGTVKLVPITRIVEFGDSPITRTMESLLEGPTEAEKQKGIISFIPQGTRLLSAHIENGHLTLNFNDVFEHNYTGRQAILFELSQVMFTCFDIQQVTRLSILIEGTSKKYITGEGIPLKEVYTKKDLSELNVEG
jgi:spore germination protein GerM